MHNLTKSCNFARFLRARAYMGAEKTYGLSAVSTRLIGVTALLCVLFMPAFSPYARSQAIALGTNVSNAPTIVMRTDALVTDGEENFFVLPVAYLPTTVYYLPDTAFGPVPYLIDFVSGDTLLSEMTFDDCHMAWKWEVKPVNDEVEQLYLYFATHETASALIIPACLPDEKTLPDTAVCVAYQWGDTTIYDSGKYTRHFVNAFGCDSVVTQLVTILQPSEYTDNVVAYDSLKWINGITYYKNISGPVYTTENVAGCDSIITLNLTIRHLWKDTVRATVCRSELPYQWRGQSYTQSDIYSTDTILGPVEGKVYQDSLHSLILTVNPTFAVDTFVTICDSSYTWHGQKCLTSGVYTDSLKSVDGCDSVIQLHLTLTDECFPKEYTCIEALTRIDEAIIINRALVEDFEDMSIQWMCNDTPIDTDVDRLWMANRSDGEYSAYLIARDCAGCDTTWLCPTTYQSAISDSEKRAVVSVHPTYIDAAQPYTYLTATAGAGQYYLYGPAGKVVVRGEYTDSTGEQKIMVPAMPGFYVLICMPEGETNMKHVVQKIKLLVY